MTASDDTTTALALDAEEPTLTTLLNFDGANGRSPYGGLIADASGDLFGTAETGGVYGDGTVFELVNNGDGAYAATVLVSFDVTDGALPYAGLAADGAGNLFGTTSYGPFPGQFGGTAFELPETGGGYASVPTTLAAFSVADGASPQAGLLVDAAGNLFGTTSTLGPNGDGTVFEIPNTSAGYGTRITLASFNFATTGGLPSAGLIEDAAGDLFGTTFGGGPGGSGAVFEIPLVAGAYASTPTVLASFNGTNGANPYAGLVADAAGDLFGTTHGDGLGPGGSGGTVFEIVKTATGYASTPTTLVGFSGPDGLYPLAGLIIDAAGDLFGTTAYGGTDAAGSIGGFGGGTVFEVARTSTGYASTATTLVSFDGANGHYPAYGSLIADAQGDLFGTTYGGGAYGAGTVFELSNSGFKTPVAGLPDVSGSFTPAVYAMLQSLLAVLAPAGVAANVVDTAGSGATPTVAGALNALVFTASAAGATDTLPAGFAVGYLLSGAATLGDANGGVALIDAASDATLTGTAADTLFGGNADATLVATSGAETLFGGTGADLIELGASNAVAITQGTDTIVGSTASDTVNASGAPLFFGAAGTTLFNALGSTATLVGGGAETVSAGSANVLLFGGAGGVDFDAGSGASTVVGGAGGNTLTGGAGATLYFGNGSNVYVAGPAVDTVVGFGGSLTGTGGPNGTLFFTGTAGGSDVGTGSGSSTIIGFGANDSLTATGAGADVIEAAAASDTIDATASSGSDAFFAFGQNDVVLAGSGATAVQSYVGNQTLSAGAGADLFVVVESGQRAVTLVNFAPGQDFAQLQGYGAGAGAAALRTAVSGPAGEVLTLSDGTQLTFQGITNLTASSFV